VRDPAGQSGLGKADSVREMRVMAVGVESGASRPVLLLQEAAGDHRLLPVWIGPAEANAIAVEQQGVSLPRPMTHQLIGDVIDALGRQLQQVRITEVRGNIFYAELILDRNTRVSARVSDAIALALHQSGSKSSGDVVSRNRRNCSMPVPPTVHW
jgi:bifunctional DNase/RNase